MMLREQINTALVVVSWVYIQESASTDGCCEKVYCWIQIFLHVLIFH